MANLAIKGHKTRGKEVIELLEMLGGENANNCYGKYCDRVYYINENGYIDQDFTPHIEQDTKFIIFSLEEFLEKFPYKVGDKVQHKGATSCGSVFEIEKMRRVDNHVEYTIKRLWYNNCHTTVKAEHLQPYKEETNKVIFEANAQCCDITNKIIQKEKAMKEDAKILIGVVPTYKGNEIIPHKNYEIKQEGDKYYLVKKKPQYPKTYKECCEVLMGKTNFQDFELVLTKLSTNINEENSISPEPPYITSINNLYKLLICRDAYWKIAGDWNLDLVSDEDGCNTAKFCIKNFENEIVRIEAIEVNTILAFPTEEMRDTFYENFKELIEPCKELL